MKKVIIIIIVVAFGAGVYYFFAPANQNLSNQDKNDAVKKILGRDVRSGTNIPSGSKLYSGKYFSFSYPAAATEYTYNKDKILRQKFVLDSFQLQQMGGPKYFLTTKVEDATVSASIDELTGVSFRKNSSDYKSSKQTSGFAALIFTKDKPGDAETSAFFEANKRYYTFIITGQDLTELKPVFDEILATIKVK